MFGLNTTEKAFILFYFITHLFAVWGTEPSTFKLVGRYSITE